MPRGGNVRCSSHRGRTLKRSRDVVVDDMISQAEAAAKLRLVAAMVDTGLITLDGYRIDMVIMDGGSQATLSAVVADG